MLPHPSGHPWSKTAWGNWRRRDFNPAREAAGIDALRPYDLRHTFASLLLAEGRTVHYVAEQLGHSAMMTLRTYGHVIADYRDRRRSTRRSKFAALGPPSIRPPGIERLR